ncbi:ferrous iron transport protein B [Prevotella communis]|uniref:Ferrous iron transport protein B n=2 Tax=Prevotella TaxID=838 RepID=A0A1H0KJV3_9BACT|nr:ferrous iron transport protein B [Prevotella communis]UKK55506.1 ferrous iron transport protein B [Prevotella communis]UKK60985.1 ferrous iron transport protein B [Prevotella communis]UKK63811.1 ferrous iron transport protein B [Prevotella communis]SDH36839.1 ferrous iron transport protein B [Prevotella communis]SDO56113.1 ferrous iron transport protein B [Prevotella communis]
MKLSELKNGEQGVIVKVLGHGGFRKRIIEMGFIKGQTVEVLQNAPLQDPVKYRIMGYEVSLRRQEAEQVVVVSVSEAHEMESQVVLQGHEEDYLQHRALQQRRTIHVALVGNPNCGKTSLFNFASGAHAHVGNYSGVTVDAAEAHAQMFGYEFLLTDLPGTYSLSCYSPEELYVRKHLSEQMPDVVINVVDASNLERNLYLTTQLVDMNVRMVCALNMYDEFERRGDKLDIPTLSSLFGMPMIPTSFKTGRGLKELFRAVIQVYEGKQGTSRHLHINYGHEIEQGISHIQQYLKADEHIRQRYSTRYLAIKLLEHDSDVLQYIGQHLAEEHRPEDRKQLLQARDVAAARVQEETGSDSETAIMDAKYGFINGALKEAGYVTGTKEDTYRTTHRIDHILSHKVWGFPVFFAILFIMFQTTFMLGQYPMDWIDAGVEWLGEWIGTTMEDGPLRSMLVDGVIGGVGSVIVFLPQILILYCFISIMEDSGYMARAAFIMDKLMHKMGLHGKSFIPLVMGFGCNVPAVMATRTIESRRSRLITMMILPLMSCSARLPIYIMIIGTFFAVEYQSWIMISLYAIGILLSVVVSKVFSSFIIKGDDTPFVMELPPYRFPTLKAVVRHTWEKGKEYLKKMGGIILVASILVWAMGYFSFTGVAESMETSIIGRMGQAVAPVFAPQGFNWQLDVSLITGVGAKEIVASSIGVLGGLESLTPLQAYCYLLFVLIYFPCIATVVAIKNETGSWRWACVSAVYTTCLAWVVSAVVYQIGSLLC